MRPWNEETPRRPSPSWRLGRRGVGHAVSVYRMLRTNEPGMLVPPNPPYCLPTATWPRAAPVRNASRMDAVRASDPVWHDPIGPDDGGGPRSAGSPAGPSPRAGCLHGEHCRVSVGGLACGEHHLVDRHSSEVDDLIAVASESDQLTRAVARALVDIRGAAVTVGVPLIPAASRYPVRAGRLRSDRDGRSHRRGGVRARGNQERRRLSRARAPTADGRHAHAATGLVVLAIRVPLERRDVPAPEQLPHDVARRPGRHRVGWHHPRNFRKTVATVVRDELGIEAARDQLGHEETKTTERSYADEIHRGPAAASVLSELLARKP